MIDRNEPSEMDHMKKYVMTKEECEKNIKGVCEGCGGHLSAIETVDNSNNHTFWQGCWHCSCFRGGVDQRYFKIARNLVEKGVMIPFDYMNRAEYEKDGDLEYYLSTQTASLARDIAHIDELLREYKEGV